MPALDLKNLISQIKTNCNISDAKFWGSYSLCGLLLRFRELYRKENNIQPWEQISQANIGEWISSRENLWNTIENQDFADIAVNNQIFHPFDTEPINKLLNQKRIIYGAGYGAYMKPSFFLAELLSKKIIENYDVYISGNEYSRDLSAYPAMLQNNIIFARIDALSIILWNKFEELKLKKSGGAVSYAFFIYGLHDDEDASEATFNKIIEITEKELESYIYHEIGEAFEGIKLGSDWKTMLLEIQNRHVEFFLRGIKDVLSDTSEKGMLMHIIEKQKKGSLGFYMSFLGGFRKIIFPEIINVFQDFIKSADWLIIDKARKTGYNKAKELALKVIEIYNNEKDKTCVDKIIENDLICPFKSH